MDQCGMIFSAAFTVLRGHSKDNKKNLLFVCNFTPMERPDYRVGVTRRKQLKLVLNSDENEIRRFRAERPLIYKPVKTGVRRKEIFYRVSACRHMELPCLNSDRKVSDISYEIRE